MTFLTAMPTSRKSESPSHTFSAIVYYAPAAVWGFFILYFSLMPGDEVPDLLNDMNDKILHGFIYLLFSFLMHLGYTKFVLFDGGTILELLTILLVCTVIGGLVEVIQHLWVLNRNGDWQDFAANALGSLMCVLLIRLVYRLRA